MEYRRAGVLPESAKAADVILGVIALQKLEHCTFYGLYCHAGNSYDARAFAEVANYALKELQALQKVAEQVRSLGEVPSLVCSFGASPTARAIQNSAIVKDGVPSHLVPDASTEVATDLSKEITKFKDLLPQFSLEVHAGGMYSKSPFWTSAPMQCIM